MLLYVYNSNFRRITIIHNYEFAQYVDKLSDIGTFEIKAIFDDKTKMLLDKDKTFFVSFDKEVIGYIVGVEKEDVSGKKSLNIKGKLLQFILTRKVVYKMQSFKGKSFEVVQQAIVNNCISNNINPATNLQRTTVKIDVSDLVQQAGSIIDIQKTGGSVWDLIQPLLEQDELGIEYEIEVVDVEVIDGVETNVKGLTIRVFSGKDRRRCNTSGNKPIVLSQSNSNISNVSYELDSSEYFNVAYVAGEEGGENRVWTTVDNGGKTGYERFELFVDARDLQSTNEDGTVISAEEYKKLLVQRGNSKLGESIITEGIDATMVSQRYKYGKDGDLYKGDFVTIFDVDANRSVDAQITEVTKSYQGSQEIVDISFGYKKIQVWEKNRSRGGV